MLKNKKTFKNDLRQLNARVWSLLTKKQIYYSYYWNKLNTAFWNKWTIESKSYLLTVNLTINNSLKLFAILEYYKNYVKS